MRNYWASPLFSSLTWASSKITSIKAALYELSPWCSFLLSLSLEACVVVDHMCEVVGVSLRAPPAAQVGSK